MGKLLSYLGRPVDGGSLALFRIAYGLTVAWMLARAINSGELDAFVRPGGEVGYTFAYPGLSFVRPLPSPWMTGLLGLSLACALGVAGGFFYRVFVVLFFLSFAYIMHVDRTLYGNHLVLAAVFGFLLVWMPAQRRFSFDRLFWPTSPRLAGDPPGTVPFWTIVLLRAQVLLIYFFGGVSKLHPDWLAGEPMRTWFQGAALAASRVPESEQTLSQTMDRLLATEPMIHCIGYGGLIFDLGIGFLLLFRRTRVLGITLAAGFHAFNFFRVENVGRVAPLAFAGTLMFLDPDWPDRLFRWLRHPSLKKPDLGWLIAGLILLPGIGALLGWKLAPTSNSAPQRKTSPWVAAGVVGWILLAVLIPLRHFAIPGDAYWTEEGVRYSWFLLTRNKVGGFVQFQVQDPNLFIQDSKQKWSIDWSKWKGEKPKVLYQEVDPRNVPWYTMPEFFVTYEPLFGERVFFNTGATNFVGFEAAKTYAEKRWQEMYGRKPDLVLPSFPFARILDAEIRLRQAKVDSQNRKQQGILAALLQLREWAERMRNRSLSEEDFRWQLFMDQGYLQVLAQIAHVDKEFFNRLLTTSPFDLQGNPTPPIAPLIIVDRALLDQAKNAIWKIDRTLWRGSDVTYVALDVFFPQYLASLPELLFVYDTAGKPKVVWNHARELTETQMRNLAIVPSIAQQYAEHIAATWERLQGRRPAVHAEIYVRLNQHPFQRFIDPKVDLAAKSSSAMVHSEWILPMHP